MLPKISRRFFLGGIASLGAAPLLANAPLQSLRPFARGQSAPLPLTKGAAQLVADARLGGRVAYAVAGLRGGNILEERASTLGLPPASVTKAVTALYALETLGSAFRFDTQIIATGSITGGVISGDLILAGGGDPTLDTDGLAAMAAELKRRGIREVRGRFLVWGGSVSAIKEIDRDQPDHVGYNPTISGLNLNFNRVHFEWKPAGSGWKVAMDARSEKYRPEVRISRMTVKAREVPVYTYRDAGGHDAWTVASGALGKGGSRWLPVRKPEIYAGEVFQTFARAHGISLKAPQVSRNAPNGQVLVRRQSEPLPVILRDMLKFSTNLTAEIVGLTATARRGGNARSLKGSAQAMSTWAETSLAMKNTRFVDHSGLGDASRMTASAMVTALLRARSRGLMPLLKQISMRDARGRPIKNHPIKVRAKTGTLNFVSCLAGYVTAPDGTEMAFAILAGDPARRARLSEAERERPQGAGAWNKRAKQLQQKLIERWGAVYGS